MRQPAVFVGHGVPSILMNESDLTAAWLARFGASLRSVPPSAIVCVSAHFVAPRLTVTTAEAPETLREHDVPQANSVSYRPPGSRRVARRVLEALLHAGLDAIGDDSRRIDHGAWLPLSYMFPEASTPVVELSLHAALDPEVHFLLGRAIEHLRDEGVLVLGSGGVTYDASERDRRAHAGDLLHALPEPSRRFQSWVTDIITTSAPYTRGRGLTRFRDHADARTTHPTTEHFLPLLVVAGAASSDRNPANVAAMVHNGSHLGLSTAAFCFRY